ncbi:MAG TPA: tyrosinase family protein [bacterium]|nr:tyrosinase family protein [bacterium]
MSTVAEINARRREAGLPLIRFNLRRLQPEDIQDLRDAYNAMYEISDTSIGDSRGYWAIARGHGYDEDLCHNDSRIFLTWHRAYIYMFERALSAALRWKRGNPDLWLTLPFWDWTVIDPSTDAANGIPNVLNDPTYTDSNGNEQRNPLHAARSLWREQNQGQPAPAWTLRSPGAFAAAVPGLKDDVDRNLTNPSYEGFSNDLNGGAHGTVHVRVSGDMGSVVSAAYDPLFWLHHSMVDKVWFDWQTRNRNATVPQHVLDASIYGGLTGAGVVDAESQLLYTYSDEEVETAVEVGGTTDDAAEPPPEEPEEEASPAVEEAADEERDPTEPAPRSEYRGRHRTLRLGKVHGPFKRAQLDFHQMRPPTQNYEIRVYFNNPDANHQTPATDPSYGGRIVLFGHGRCHGARGHCDPSQAERDSYDLRRKHHLRYRHTRYAVDVTRGLRRLLKQANGKPTEVNATFVVLDANERAVPHRELRYRGVSLSTLS